MRAATLFVAVLCATLPAVHGRERLKTSENAPPPPDKDGTRTGKPEDPNPAGPIKQASSLCYGFQHGLGPQPGHVCAISFTRTKDRDCKAVLKLIVPDPKEFSSSDVKCEKRTNSEAECYCGGRDCNVDTEAISRALTTLINANKIELPWLTKCRQALENLEETPDVDNEEIPTTGKPKQDKTTNPPKSTSAPKDLSNVKTTSAAPSVPVSTPVDPNSHRSKRCSGELAYLGGVEGKGHPYCAYEFKKGDDKSCSAVAQERFVAREKDFSGSGGTLCDKADGGKIICLCEGDKCNNNTEAISKKLQEFLEKVAKEGSNWTKDCVKKLIAGKSKGSGDGKSTTRKTTKGPERTPEGGTPTDAPEEQKHSTGSPVIPTTTISSYAPDDLTASTNSTVATSPSLLQQPKDEGSSIVFGLLIGSIVFNVLTVATIIAMAIVIIKMKKGGGKGKEEVKKVAPPPIMEIKIENPAKKKVPSVAPATTEPKETKVYQGEAAADTTMLATAQDDLDTTGSSTISDTTGTTDQSQVNFTVSGFKQN